MTCPTQEPKPQGPKPEHVLGFLGTFLTLIAAIIAMAKSNRPKD